MQLGKFLLLISELLFNASPYFLALYFRVLPCKFFLLKQPQFFCFLKLNDLWCYASFCLRVVFLLCDIYLKLIRLVDIINLFLLSSAQRLLDDLDFHVFLPISLINPSETFLPESLYVIGHSIHHIRVRFYETTGIVTNYWRRCVVRIPKLALRHNNSRRRRAHHRGYLLWHRSTHARLIVIHSEWGTNTLNKVRWDVLLRINNTCLVTVGPPSTKIILLWLEKGHVISSFFLVELSIILFM